MGIHNSENTVKRVTELTDKGALNWIYHVGDMAYADDEMEFQKTWNVFAGNVEPISAKVPYMV